MDSNELKALLGDLKRLDYPPPAAPDASFASSSRYSARDAEAEAQSILKRLKPVYGHVTGATSKVEGRMEAREADEQLPKDEDAVLKLLWSRPAFRDVVASMKDKQDKLEISTLDERNSLKAANERQLRVCGATAADASRRQQLATDMQQSLRTFDRQALSRWDTLRDEQAALLGQLGVPSFAPHSSPSSPSDRARVISKLVNMLERH